MRPKGKNVSAACAPVVLAGSIGKGKSIAVPEGKSGSCSTFAFLLQR